MPRRHEIASELLISVSDGVASLEINRPEKMNSLSPAVLNGIADALGRFSSEGDAVRCVVLSGRGGKAFSSGYDFSFIGSNDMTRDYTEKKHPLAEACEAIEQFARPVIAMVCGHVHGGGLELALACDFVICSDDSKFSMPPAKLGIAYPFSGLARVARAVGIANAKRMFFTAETLSASKALETGLVSEVVSRSALKEAADTAARQITAGAPLSIKAAKLGLNSWAEGARGKGTEEMRKAAQKAQDSDDFKEGMEAVSEKRKPVYRGK
ncbi:MAG: enoyl-CoA hydratase/isomerase family protein [Candidatus Dadabacteria bacterium]|nr:enoyl-CoA hydratase/isomerase family protein [Candidatus Dadabacteria bacterium]